MKRTLLIIGLLLCMSVSMAYAANVPLANASFEDNVIPAGTEQNIVPTGWSITHHPEYTYVGSWSYLPGQSGTNFARTYGDGSIDYGAYLYQNTGIQIQAGQVIDMSAYFATNVAWQWGMFSIGAADTPTGMMDSNGWIDGIGEFQFTTANEWVNKSGTFTIAADNAAIGKYLCIGLRATSGWVLYDNVSLDVTEVPEPSSMLLLGSGVVGLLGTVIRGRRA